MAELAVALQGHDQPYPVGEGLEILVEDQASGGPIVAPIAGMGLKGGVDTFFRLIAILRNAILWLVIRIPICESQTPIASI